MTTAEEYAQGVLDIVSKTLNEPGTDIHQPLSDMGLDSLDVIDAVMDIEERWGVEIPVDLADKPGLTSADLGKFVMENLK